MEETPRPLQDHAVESLRTHVEKLIGISVFFIGLLTFGASLAGIPAEIPQTDKAAEFIRKFAWCIYVAAWASGSLWDLSVQQKAYRHTSISKAPMLGIVVIVVITAGLLAIYYFSNPMIMAITLVLLWIADYFGWRYMLSKVVGPSVAMSTETYRREGRYFELEQLKIVSDRIAGSWKWYRCGAGTFLLAILVYVAFWNVPWPILKILSPHMQSVPKDFVMSVIMLVFVLVVEGWILFIRVRAESRVSYLEQLAHSYSLTPTEKH
jgi:hypothetical protein